MRKTGPQGLKPLAKSGFPHLGRQLPLPPHTNILALQKKKAELPSSGKAMRFSV